MIRKIPLSIPSCPFKEQMENLKKCQEAHILKGKNTLSSSLSYAQAINSAVSILKIKEAFPALPNKKILEIYNIAFFKLDNKEQKIQSTTKDPSRKQAIVPAFNKLIDIIMGEANTHIFQINMLLRNIKSILRAKFIHPCPGGVSINTNNVLNPSDLTTMEQYLKSINSANNNEILASHLS